MGIQQWILEGGGGENNGDGEIVCVKIHTTMYWIQFTF